MSIINFKEANCKNCYKCVRECPVKSISVVSEQARILEKDCVLCGHCLFACPQHAKEISNEVPVIKSFLEKGEKVYVSLAPSFPAYFNANIAQMSAAIKKLGFTAVEETAVGAARVSESYENLIVEHKMKNIITTACPTVVMTVQKYFPELIDYLAPVVSPVLAHTMAMKEAYGEDIKVVFVGPCISKKHDVIDVANEGILSAAITFDELEEWLLQENIQIGEEDESQKGIRKPVARFYPVPGGIIKTISKDKRKIYRCMAVDGMDMCLGILRSLKDEDLSGYFIEMNACAGACVSGPGLKKTPFLKAKDDVYTSIDDCSDKDNFESDDENVNISRKYVVLTSEEKQPTEEDIKRILAKIGKTTKEDELNCGSCGYNTCRDKAVAVFQGKAEVEMCIPYMRKKAESMSNQIIDASPTGIIAVNGDFIIQEANPAACRLFNITKSVFVGKNIFEVLPSDMYFDLQPSQVKTAKQHYDEYNLIAEQTVVRIGNTDSLIVMLKDITDEEERQENEQAMRNQTIELTQKVIDKQMRVAQEIASLLGETTAETKVVLTKLKNSMTKESKE